MKTFTEQGWGGGGTVYYTRGSGFIKQADNKNMINLRFWLAQCSVLKAQASLNKQTIKM